MYFNNYYCSADYEDEILRLSAATPIPKFISPEFQILYAARVNDQPQVIALIEADHNLVHTQGFDLMTLLHHAAENSNCDLAQFLVNNGANVNAQGPYSMTPLHYAARNGDTCMANFLISRGANVNVLDSWNRTPLYLAARMSRFYVVKLLLNQPNIEVNTQEDRELNTPLHVALRYSHPYVAVALINSGKADLNLQDHLGQTPLHIAAWAPLPLALLELLKNGADPNILDIYGHKPLYYSQDRYKTDPKKYQHKSDINLLRRYGATE